MLEAWRDATTSRRLELNSLSVVTELLAGCACDDETNSKSGAMFEREPSESRFPQPANADGGEVFRRRSLVVWISASPKLLQ